MRSNLSRYAVVGVLWMFGAGAAAEHCGGSLKVSSGERADGGIDAAIPVSSFDVIIDKKGRYVDILPPEHVREERMAWTRVYAEGGSLDADGDGLPELTVEIDGSFRRATHFQYGIRTRVEESVDGKPTSTWMDTDLDGWPEKTIRYTYSPGERVMEERSYYAGSVRVREQTSGGRNKMVRVRTWTERTGADGSMQIENMTTTETGFHDAFRMACVVRPNGDAPLKPPCSPSGGCVMLDDDLAKDVSGKIRVITRDFDPVLGCDITDPASGGLSPLVLALSGASRELNGRGVACLQGINPDWGNAIRVAIATTGVIVDCGVDNSQCPAGTAKTLAEGYPGQECAWSSPDVPGARTPRISVDPVRFLTLSADARSETILHEAIHAATGVSHVNVGSTVGVDMRHGAARALAEGAYSDPIYACGVFCGACGDYAGEFDIRTHDAGPYERRTMACARCAMDAKKDLCGAKDIPNLEAIFDGDDASVPPLCTQSERRAAPLDCSAVTHQNKLVMGSGHLDYDDIGLCYRWNPELGVYWPLDTVMCNTANFSTKVSCDDNFFVHRGLKVVRDVSGLVVQSTTGLVEDRVAQAVCTEDCPNGSAGGRNADITGTFPACERLFDEEMTKLSTCEYPVGEGVNWICEG